MQPTAIVLMVVAAFGLCSHAYFLDYEDDYAQTPAQDKVFGELPKFNITPYIIVLSEHHNAIVQASFLFNSVK